MLTRRMALDALIARMRGEAPDTAIKVSDFPDPWKAYYKAIEYAEAGRERDILYSIAKPEDIQALVTHTPEEMTYKSLDEEKDDIKPITYYWDRWIVNGKINLFGGYPGVGKTTINLSLIRYQLHEKFFPDAAPILETGKPVLYIDGENYRDGILDTAQNMGIDIRRLWVWSPRQKDVTIDFSLPQNQDELVERIYKIRPAIIYADSLSCFTPTGDDKDIKEIRTVLGFFNAIASEFNIPLALDHHPRKQVDFFTASDQAKLLRLDDFRGSGLIGALARVAVGISVVQTAKEQDENSPYRIMYQMKNSKADKVKIGFEFVKLVNGGVTLKWGEPAKPYKSPDMTDECKEWLTDLLMDAGELAPKNVIALGAEKSYSRATIYRARKDLPQIQDVCKSKYDPANAWRWIESEAQNDNE
jgi:hypothetical protein